MSQVGIPIKLLYEAEGMKVTVEVGLLVYSYAVPHVHMLCCCFELCAQLVYPNAKKISHGFRLSIPPYIYPVQIYYMI